MTNPIYMEISQAIRKNIISKKYTDQKLPDERSMAEDFGVSRSSIKRAIQLLVDQGIIFKKQGSGNFINPLFLKNEAPLDYSGDNLGLTTSIVTNGKKQIIRVLGINVVKPDIDIRRSLVLKEGEFTYEFKRLRILDDEPILVEKSYIPVKVFPDLSEKLLEKSLFNYLEDEKGEIISRAYLDISASPSNSDDQKYLNLSKNEPVGIISGIFFLDDGTPFEYSTMRLHYRYLNFSTYVNLDK